MFFKVLEDFPAAPDRSRPAGSIGEVRRPPVRRARCAKRRNLPVLLRFFNFFSSSSSLHAFKLFLQFLCSTFCIVFGSLGRFSPLHILPIGLIHPPGQSPRLFFKDFLRFFAFYFFAIFPACFFKLFLVILSPHGDPNIKSKLVKIFVGRRFLDDFHFCVKI